MPSNNSTGDPTQVLGAPSSKKGGRTELHNYIYVCFLYIRQGRRKDKRNFR